jgi:hypothetical protein
MAIVSGGIVVKILRKDSGQYSLIMECIRWSLPWVMSLSKERML